LPSVAGDNDQRNDRLSARRRRPGRIDRLREGDVEVVLRAPHSAANPPTVQGATAARHRALGDLGDLGDAQRPSTIRLASTSVIPVSCRRRLIAWVSLTASCELEHLGWDGAVPVAGSARERRTLDAEVVGDQLELLLDGAEALGQCRVVHRSMLSAD
jgi:hypothetical protein